MINNISTRFEINMQSTAASDISSASTFMIRNRIPAMIVNPELFIPAIADRQMKMRRGVPPYSIIAAIGFNNNGKQYAMDKIRDLPKEILDADGFDIMITPNKSEIETNKEMSALGDFLRQVNPMAEIRWTLGCRTQSIDSIVKVLKMVANNPASYIRTDNNVTVPEFDRRSHQVDIALIRKHIGTAIKLSGNIDLQTIQETRDSVSRYDVTVAAARSIIAGAEKANEELAEARAADEDS